MLNSNQGSNLNQLANLHDYSPYEIAGGHDRNMNMISGGL